jgi:hypothetical protein
MAAMKWKFVQKGANASDEDPEIIVVDRDPIIRKEFWIRI